MDGVGTAILAAKILPSTIFEVEKVSDASRAWPKPVIKVSAAGLTAISPVMAVVPVVEMPVFASIT